MKGTSSARRVLLLCFVAYSIVYMGRQNISIASPLLEGDGILGKAQIGILGSVFFFVYAFGRVINGWVGDQFPPKPFLVTGFLLSGLCNLGFAFLPPAGMMYLLWGLNGFFQSMLWGAALRNVSLAYPQEAEAKRAAVILSISGGTGAILGIIVPTGLAGWGVEAVFGISGIILMGVSLMLLLGLPSAGEKKTAAKSKVPELSCLKNRELRRMFYPAVIHGAIKENLTLWLPLFFMDRYCLDLTSAAGYIFLMPMATLLGRLLFPFWQRQCRSSERLTLVSAFLTGGGLLLPFLFETMAPWLSAVLLALSSVILSVVNTELISVYPVNYQAANEVSTVAGLLDFAVYIGAALGSAVFGYLILFMGYHKMFVVLGILSATAVLPMVLRK